MALYEITTWDVNLLVTDTRVMRRTYTSAVNAAWAQAYEVLGAFGKLDTTAAWETKRFIDMWASAKNRTVTLRTVEISNTGKSVRIERLS